MTHLVGQVGISDGLLLLLQVTSPLRTRGDLDRLCALYEGTPDADAAVSLCAYSVPAPRQDADSE